MPRPLPSRFDWRRAAWLALAAGWLGLFLGDLLAHPLAATRLGPPTVAVALIPTALLAVQAWRPTARGWAAIGAGAAALLVWLAVDEVSAARQVEAIAKASPGATVEAVAGALLLGLGLAWVLVLLWPPDAAE